VSGTQPDERFGLARRGVERLHCRARHLRVVDPVDHDERPRCYERCVALGLQLAERTQRQPRGGIAQRARPECQVGRQNAIQITGAVDQYHVAESRVERRGDDREWHRERGGGNGHAGGVDIRAAGEVRRTEREERRHLLGGRT
jgi:hypothetical protein